MVAVAEDDKTFHSSGLGVNVIGDQPIIATLTWPIDIPTDGVLLQNRRIEGLPTCDSNSVY